jgi:hypothetical protein
MEFDSSVAGPARYRNVAPQMGLSYRCGYRYMYRGGGEHRFNGTFQLFATTNSSFRPSNSRARRTPSTLNTCGSRTSAADPAGLRGRSVCPDIEARHALLSPGMGRGAAEGYALARQPALVAVTELRRCQLEHVQPHRRIRRVVPSIDVGANSAVVKHEGRCCRHELVHRRPCRLRGKGVACSALHVTSVI